LTLPLSDEDIASLKAGDKVLLSGTLYTVRDMAHRRLAEFLQDKRSLPFDLKDAAILYAGPSPAKPGQLCGAIGPTTSERMDRYTPALLAAGVKVLIGKGMRSSEVIHALKTHKAVYLVAVGGAAALLSQTVLSCETCCWEDLGPEAVYRLEVKDFPCYVSIV